MKGRSKMSRLGAFMLMGLYLSPSVSWELACKLTLHLPLAAYFLEGSMLAGLLPSFLC